MQMKKAKYKCIVQISSPCEKVKEKYLRYYIKTKYKVNYRKQKRWKRIM